MVRSTTQRRGSTTNPLTRSERLMMSVLSCGRILRERLLQLRSLIAAVGEQLLQKRIYPEQSGKQHDAAIAILDVGGVNDGVKQQTQRVYE